MTTSSLIDRAHPSGSRRIVARAPARLDLGGGWTDVPPYADEVGGVVCNVAIQRYATVSLQTGDGAWSVAGRHERMPRLAVAALRRARLDATSAPTVDVWSDFPVSAGLGGSSAAGVALAAAVARWQGELAVDSPIDDARRAALAEWSRAVEVEDAGIAGGRQDHYAAAFGGALRIDFGPDAGGAPARARRVPLEAETRAALARRGIVVYTGESRVSGSTIVAVLEAYARGEPLVVRALARMREIAIAMADALAAGALDELGALLAEHWTHQRSLHPSIPTPRIDAVIERATAAGALGAKALGASGGGCVLALAADDREAAVRDAVASLGELVSFEIDVDGVRVDEMSA